MASFRRGHVLFFYDESQGLLWKDEISSVSKQFLFFENLPENIIHDSDYITSSMSNIFFFPFIGLEEGYLTTKKLSVFTKNWASFYKQKPHNVDVSGYTIAKHINSIKVCKRKEVLEKYFISSFKKAHNLIEQKNSELSKKLRTSELSLYNEELIREIFLENLKASEQLQQRQTKVEQFIKKL